MVQNIDKSWKCMHHQKYLFWSREDGGYICSRCGELLVPVSTLKTKPPGIIERLKTWWKNK